MLNLSFIWVRKMKAITIPVFGLLMLMITTIGFFIIWASGSTMESKSLLKGELAISLGHHCDLEMRGLKASAPAIAEQPINELAQHGGALTGTAEIKKWTYDDPEVGIDNLKYVLEYKVLSSLPIDSYNLGSSERMLILNEPYIKFEFGADDCGGIVDVPVYNVVNNVKTLEKTYQYSNKPKCLRFKGAQNFTIYDNLIRGNCFVSFNYDEKINTGYMKLINAARLMYDDGIYDYSSSIATETSDASGGVNITSIDDKYDKCSVILWEPSVISQFSSTTSPDPGFTRKEGLKNSIDYAITCGWKDKLGLASIKKEELSEDVIKGNISKVLNSFNESYNNIYSSQNMEFNYSIEDVRKLGENDYVSDIKFTLRDKNTILESDPLKIKVKYLELYFMDQMMFIISDDIRPTYTNNETQALSFYSPTSYSNFSVTWDDNSGDVDAYIVADFTGSYEEYKMLGTYPNFYYNTTVLPAGRYNYRFMANDSFGNQNTTSDSSFTIAKAPTEVHLYLDNIQGDRTYTQNEIANFTATVNVSELAVSISTNITGWTEPSGITAVYNTNQLTYIGVFNITGYTVGNVNYTGSYETWYANVTAVIP